MAAAIGEDRHEHERQDHDGAPEAGSNRAHDADAGAKVMRMWY